METLQHDWELEQLQALARGLNPFAILEIGVWDGGTLAGWVESSARLVVGLDVQFRPGVKERFANQAVLIEGNCEDLTVLDQIRSWGLYGLIFLDADHQYDAAKRHWNLYGQLVAPGGVFAFHDIRRYEHGDLDRLWAEIKAEPGSRTVEFHQNNASWGGIGAVYL